MRRCRFKGDLAFNSYFSINRDILLHLISLPPDGIDRRPIYFQIFYQLTHLPTKIL